MRIYLIGVYLRDNTDVPSDVNEQHRFSLIISKYGCGGQLRKIHIKENSIIQIYFITVYLRDTTDVPSDVNEQHRFSLNYITMRLR